MASKRIIFTGIQPTGNLHIGNYFGAIKSLVDFKQKSALKSGLKYDALSDGKVDLNGDFISIANYHALTKPSSKTDSTELCRQLMALGLDDSTIFRQSDVPQHASLMWILQSQVSLSRLERFVHWQEKAERYQRNAALLCYPILQAADILLYDSDIVPIGEDQIHHLELTRHLAKKINNLAKDKVFTLPKALVSRIKIRDLRDASKKMSKSNASCLYIFDDEQNIISHLKSAVTDSLPGLSYDPVKRPGLSALIELLSLLSGESIPEIVERNVSFSRLKDELIGSFFEYFKLARKEYQLIDLKYADAFLNANGATCRGIAEENLAKTKRKLGIL